jgi:hypothetical protein
MWVEMGDDGDWYWVLDIGCWMLDVEMYEQWHAIVVFMR